MTLPEKLPIRWMPDLHTAHVGRFRDSEQFFVAHHLVPSASGDSPNREYVALYCFDGTGTLTSHRIIGPLNHAIDETVSSLLAHLGHHEFTDICVSPFQVAFDGHIFGLVPDSQHRTINLEPGSMITFTEPWDGEYYT